MNPFIQKIGAFYHPAASEFIVWAPLKKSVELTITAPKAAVHPMQKDEWGYWKINILAPEGARYFFQLDNKSHKPDPASVSQPNGVHKASELISRNFFWSDEKWNGLSLDEMIIYELHTGTFTPRHNFDGVIKKLNYLKELGITAIEIMPIGQFPGNRDWGYDGVYPFAVQNSYGGANGLKKLVNVAHEKQIAVLLDVVYNHAGPEGNYLQDYAPYFTDKYKTPWGKAVNFDDEYCDGVRNYFFQNALQWLDEFHIDGLRLDAVHAIWDFSAHHFVQELKDQVNEIEKKTGCKKVLIAEIDLNDARYVRSVENCGYGLDAQWADEFHHALHTILTGEKNGYYEDFWHMHQLGKAFRDTYVYDGIYSPYRKKIFGSDASDIPYHKFVVFSQNHDQVGNRLMGDRLSAQLSFEQLEVAAATVLLSPYIPLLFMGEEYAEKNPFLFFVSYTDPDLINGTREGRKKEFSYFDSGEEFPDPQSQETFDKSVLSWDYRDNKEQAVMLEFYKQLIAFRKTHRALQQKNRESMKVHSVQEGKILFFERIAASEDLFILISFDEKDISLSLGLTFPVEKIFNSTEKKWLGNNANNISLIQPGTIFIIPSFAVLIFEKKIFL